MRLFRRAVGYALPWLGLGLLLRADAGLPLDPPRPKLIVVISVDQMRADYLHRFESYFSEGGFRRFAREGRVYQNCHYRCSLTATAPGHATIATGVSAVTHGIVANEWYDPSSQRMVGAVQDVDYPLVGGPASSLLRSPGGALEAKFGLSGVSPRRLLSPTVGDMVKQRWGDRAKVIAVANKDRAALLLGGRSCDGAYWVHDGRFVTSTFYRPALPSWVNAFNETRPIEKAFGAIWDRLLPVAEYDRTQGPDAAEGEESRLGLGVTFPRRIDGGLASPGQTFFEAHRLTPPSSEVLTDFAIAAIEGESLGKEERIDILCVGYSQVDYAGHSYGPDSHEIMDIMIRLDLQIERLLKALDSHVGVGNYLVVLSADHAVSPLPERVKAATGQDSAGRIDWPALMKRGNEALSRAYGTTDATEDWLIRDAYSFHLRAERLASAGVARSLAAKVLKEALGSAPEVSSVWTRAEILGEELTAPHRHLDAWRLSFHRERSADVVFTPKPFFVDRSPFGTNHGTPYHYDTHVPLLWLGARVPPGRLMDQVSPESIAPTLASILGVDAPPEARQPLLF